MSELIVRQLNQRIIVDEATRRISVINAGPPGPAGEQGPPGSGGNGIAYEYVQASPNASWVINHNLGYFPNFNVDEAGTGVGLEPAWIHHSNMQLELQFNTPRAGTARLS